MWILITAVSLVKYKLMLFTPTHENHTRTQVVAFVLWSMKKTRPLGAMAVAHPGGNGSSASATVLRDGTGSSCSD